MDSPLLVVGLKGLEVGSPSLEELSAPLAVGHHTHRVAGLRGVGVDVCEGDGNVHYFQGGGVCKSRES